jgi:hypothetical protein
VINMSNDRKVTNVLHKIQSNLNEIRLVQQTVGR